MKSELIEKVIQGVVQLGMWGISAFALVSAVQAFFKERSIGKSALEKLRLEHDTIKREFEDLKREHAAMADDISDVGSKYEKLIEKILNNFPFK